jgi:hypothetical protein
MRKLSFWQFVDKFTGVPVERKMRLRHMLIKHGFRKMAIMVRPDPIVSQEAL